MKCVSWFFVQAQRLALTVPLTAACGGHGHVGEGAGAGGQGNHGQGRAGSGGSSGAQAWSAEDLGQGQCFGVNATGQVLGLNADGNSFVIQTDATRTLLGSMPDGSPATATALSATGVVVGFSETDSGRVAIRYVAGTWEALAGLDGDWSMAAAVDARGRIGGTTGTTDGKVHAFLWQDGASKSLPVAETSSSSTLALSNDRVAGVMRVDDATHGFVAATDGTLVDLGTLGGTNSNPFGMNDAGTVVGSAHGDGDVVQAFMWRPGTKLRGLGVPDGARASEARGVDGADRVFGNVIDASGVARAVLFASGTTSELPLPQSSGGVAFASARLVAVAPDGTAIGTGVAPDDSDYPAHCVRWRAP